MLASGPILTTVTDMCGFFFVLSLATLLLPHLDAASRKHLDTLAAAYIQP